MSQTGDIYKALVMDAMDKDEALEKEREYSQLSPNERADRERKDAEDAYDTIVMFGKLVAFLWKIFLKGIVILCIIGFIVLIFIIIKTFMDDQTSSTASTSGDLSSQNSATITPTPSIANLTGWTRYNAPDFSIDFPSSVKYSQVQENVTPYTSNISIYGSTAPETGSIFLLVEGKSSDFYNYQNLQKIISLFLNPLISPNESINYYGTTGFNSYQGQFFTIMDKSDVQNMYGLAFTTPTHVFALLSVSKSGATDPQTEGYFESFMLNPQN